MRVILGLAVMASVVFVASLKTTKTRKDERNLAALRSVSDEEVIDILENAIHSSPHHKPKPKPHFGKSQHIPKCKTEHCTDESISMSQMMDKNVKPCENFYQYACGGWIAKGLPEDHAKWTIFAYLAEQTENKLKSLIEGQKNSANSVRKMVYNWYYSCSNQEKRDELGATPLKDLLHDTIGPDFSPFVPNDFSDEEWVLEDVLARVHRKLSVFPLFTISLGMDPKNSSSLTHLSIGQSEPLLKSRDVYLSEESHSRMIAKAYLVLLVRLIKLLMGPISPFNQEMIFEVEDEIKELLLFEVKVVKAMEDEQKEKEKALIKWTVEDFQKELPGFNWARYFNKLTEGLGNKSFHDSEEVYVGTPKYLKELFTLLKKTPKGVVANFITWFVIHDYAPYLSSKFHDVYLAFARVAYGIKKSSPLWRRCVRGTDASLDMGVSMLFIKDGGFSNESRQHAYEMVQHIRGAFIDNLKDVTWMDSETKKAAKEKAEAIFQQIGYPDFILNKTALDEYFAGMKVDPERFFENRLNEVGLRMKNTLLIRGHPINRFQWDMRPTEINAYYSPNSNKIVVPAGILRSPFFDVEYPHAKNFGAIAFVVGHELTHGFDFTGAQFDKEGNLANWWSQTSLENFKEREKCLVKQYSQCEVEGHKLSGLKTLGENTADNGGLKLAYKAYKKWLVNKDHDTTLPHLNVNSDQLFFLSFAQIWCEKSTKSYALTDLQTNVHSPGKIRVEMTLRNSVDFAKAYNCPLGSPMNPKKKCQVW